VKNIVFLPKPAVSEGVFKQNKLSRADKGDKFIARRAFIARKVSC
jgi:hypothetical protein